MTGKTYETPMAEALSVALEVSILSGENQRTLTFGEEGGAGADPDDNDAGEF